MQARRPAAPGSSNNWRANPVYQSRVLARGCPDDQSLFPTGIRHCPRHGRGMDPGSGCRPAALGGGAVYLAGLLVLPPSRCSPGTPGCRSGPARAVVPRQLLGQPGLERCLFIPGEHRSAVRLRALVGRTYCVYSAAHRERNALGRRLAGKRCSTSTCRGQSGELAGTSGSAEGGGRQLQTHTSRPGVARRCLGGPVCASLGYQDRWR